MMGYFHLSQQSVFGVEGDTSLQMEKTSLGKQK